MDKFEVEDHYFYSFPPCPFSVMKTGTINISISKYVFGQSEVAKLVVESNGSSSRDSALQTSMSIFCSVCSSLCFLFLFCVQLRMLVSIAFNFVCWYPLGLFVFAVPTFPLIGWLRIGSFECFPSLLVCFIFQPI